MTGYDRILNLLQAELLGAPVSMICSKQGNISLKVLIADFGFIIKTWYNLDQRFQKSLVVWTLEVHISRKETISNVQKTV